MRAKRPQLCIERLEEREVPAVTASLSGGVLALTGTEGADQITVRQGAGKIVVAGLSQSFPVAGVERIEVAGFGGGDAIDVSGVTVPGAIDGGAGADLIRLDPSGPIRVTGDPSDRLTLNSQPTARPYTGTQKIVAMVPAGGGFVTLFDGGGVYYSPNGWNLGGGGSTERVYLGSQRVVSMVPADGGVVTLFSGGGAYFSPNGRNLGGGGQTVLADTGISAIESRVDGSVWARPRVGSDWVYLTGGRPSVTTAGGVLTVTGTGQSDSITIATGDVSGNTVTVSAFGRSWSFSAAGLSRIVVQAGAGNDRIDLSGTRLPATVYGQMGNDTLIGGSGNDRLFGGLGTDALFGGGGNDWLDAGSAAEVADGGAGSDFNAQVWAIGSTTAGDINQRRSGTCVFLSALAAVAEKGGTNLAGRITYAGYSAYTVRLFVNGGWRDVAVTFDGNYTVDSEGVYDCVAKVEGEFWQTLYQRAYMSSIGYDPSDAARMRSFRGEPNGDRALTMITGRPAASGSIDGWSVALTPVGFQAVVKGFAGVNAYYAGHSYAVLSVYNSGGAWYVRIYNPWGFDSAHTPNIRPIADGTSDGYMTVAWDNFRATLNAYSRA